jgi:hypothetical protein
MWWRGSGMGWWGGLFIIVGDIRGEGRDRNQYVESWLRMESGG